MELENAGALATDAIVVQRSGWRDMRSIYALEKICFGDDAWPLYDVWVALTWPGIVRFKALDGERLVGFVFGDLRRRHKLGWVASLGVAPESRRLGIGRRLLTTCEQALGTPRIRLTLRQSNEAAYGLYRSEGYVEIDVWPRYYSNGENGIVMERVLRDV